MGVSQGTRFVFGWVLPALLGAGIGAAGCSDSAPSRTEDTGLFDLSFPDVGPGDAGDGDASAGDTPLSASGLGETCAEDDECGGPDDLCVELFELSRCGIDCSDDPNACPDGYACFAPPDREEGPDQCIPQDGFWDECRPEACDGADNDCDSLADEDFATLGDTCSAGVGACQRSGRIVCAGDGLEVTCGAQAGTPAEDDPCDGDDNDCDGEADEDFDDLEDDCLVGLGICERSGELVCSDDGQSTTCSVTAGEPDDDDLCDGFDNDCNGTADDDYRVVLGLRCVQGEGVCLTRGIIICTEDTLDTTCSAEPGEPHGAEVCDGQDDDCDGDTDEDEAGDPLEEVCYSGTAGTEGVGLCHAGYRVCAEGEFGPCLEEVVPSDDLCDGYDNDCAGPVDPDCRFWPGDGSDGDLTLGAGVYNLNALTHPDSGSLLAGVHQVAAIDGAQVTLTGNAAGLGQGDEVLLINLVGAAGASDQVGTYETAFVAQVQDAVVTLTQPVAEQYGAAGNDDLSGQAVAFVRVPHFGAVTVPTGASLTVNAFNGATGGVMFFRAESVVVQAGGSIHANQAGYRGRGIASNGQLGLAGESITGSGAAVAPQANAGGGGGGNTGCDVYNCTPNTVPLGPGGGGGGHGGAGASGDAHGHPSGGVGGAAYGEAPLTRLFLGSGGGGGGGGFSGPGTATAGGPGGGIVVIAAGALQVDGTIGVGGGPGAYNDNCEFAGSGGSGGSAGGTIQLSAPDLDLAPGSVGAAGGLPGGANDSCRSYLGGGAGAVGRVRLDFETLNGQDAGSAGATSAAAAAAEPDPGHLGGL